MSVNTASELPITADDLQRQLEKATRSLTAVSYTPRKDLGALRNERDPEAKKAGWASRPPVASQSAQTVQILKIAEEVNKGGALLDENINVALNVLRQGLQVGLHLGALYGKFSGFDTLQERNTKSQLAGDAEQAEWQAKKETQAAITIFATGYYVSWRLATYKTEELSGVNADFVGLPESIALGGQTQALASVLFHYGSYLKDAQTGLDFLKITQLYFKAVLDEMKARAGALKYADVFIDKSYRLEKTQFTVNGFHGEIHGAGAVVEFKRVDITKVVGNEEAKLLAWRFAQHIIAYDTDKKMNPMVEFGAFPWVSLYKGKPGTGKTLLIGALLTLISDYCKNLGLPFRPHPLPNTIVSTFQGGSAENMENWMSVLRNPAELIMAPIDDAENIFEDRTRQGVSAGVREVIGVFLRGTEGVTAINRGNVIILFASNIPEQMDRAVLSRVLWRADVDGAKTRFDFLDQMRLWSDGMEGWDKGFAGLNWPADYEFLSSQGLRRKVQNLAEEVQVFKDKRLAEIYDRVRTKYRHTEHDFYAHLYLEVLKEYPFFSSRDIRNIQTAVTTRLFDFNFPDEWLADREQFAAKDYDTKKGMILEVAHGNMRGKKVPDLLLEETAKYLDTAVSILDAGFRRRVEETVEAIGVNETARDEYRTRKGLDGSQPQA